MFIIKTNISEYVHEDLDMELQKEEGPSITQFEPGGPEEEMDDEDVEIDGYFTTMGYPLLMSPKKPKA